MKGGGGDVALVFKVQRQSYKRDNYNRETERDLLPNLSQSRQPYSRETNITSFDLSKER